MFYLVKLMLNRTQGTFYVRRISQIVYNTVTVRWYYDSDGHLVEISRGISAVLEEHQGSEGLGNWILSDSQENILKQSHDSFYVKFVPENLVAFKAGYDLKDRNL